MLGRSLLRPVIGFRSADYQPAAHEFLVVQFAYRTDRFIYRRHRYKTETLGLVGVLISYDFDVFNSTDPVEKLGDITFRCIK